jgi:hypothetical protein
MITKTPAFVTSDDKVFRTQEEAQKHELETFFDHSHTDSAVDKMIDAAVSKMLLKKDELLAILSTRKPRTPKSKPVSVGKRNRAAAVNAVLQDAKQ